MTPGTSLSFRSFVRSSGNAPGTACLSYATQTRGAHAVGADNIASPDSFDRLGPAGRFDRCVRLGSNRGGKSLAIVCRCFSCPGSELTRIFSEGWAVNRTSFRPPAPKTEPGLPSRSCTTCHHSRPPAASGTGGAQNRWADAAPLAIKLQPLTT